MTLAFCIASCACQSDTHDLPCGSAVNELAKCNGDTSIAVNTVDFLDALWILSERSKHHFNPKYRLKVCEQVIKAVASLTSAAEIPLNQLFNFISTIPRECTDSTGPLRGTVQKWLLQKKECSERNTLLDELIDFPTTFMKHTGIEGSYLYDDEDVGAWEAEARRWARTLLLVTSEEHHFKQIFTFLEKCGNKLSEHSSTRKCADVKFFIIIICLIEELEVRQKKLVHQNNAIAGGGSDTTNGLEHRALTQMFEKSLLSVLENMVAFSKQSCSVFWLKNTDNMDLPCSIKGRLGGPSQRRLATSITSSVLQCIWSMRCVSSVVSWCNHYTSDVSFHSAFSFLWEFCWEVIQHCTYATEWLCVDSLLSISSCCDENESQMKTSGSFYSDSTLQSIFIDIIESLENAGENSVVSILRCVRSVLGLIHLNRSRQNLSSLGISYEMMMQLVKSSWLLHLSCNKRRVAPIAALLSAILHPSIFPNLEMHQTNEKGPGPLKWFVETLLNEGSKSPRTIRLAALHLSGLWLMYPQTLRFYMEELKLLALYGSVAFDEDFEAELSENHEARFEVSMLAQSPDCEFTEVFINTELYARVSVAALFHQLWKQIKEKSKLETEEALQCGKLFLLKLLDSAVNDNDLSKELYKKYSSVHRRKVRVWQMICVLSHYVEEDIVEEVTSTVHTCLYRNNLPAVRQYLETFAILIYLKFPTLAEAQLVPIFHDHGMRQQALSSYVFIAANVILHSGELVVQRNHLNQLLPPIISFLTSHHHSLRSFTQLLVHTVFSKLWHILQLESSENPSIERRCFQDLKKYLAENTDCARLRVSIEGFLDVFDPDISGTPPGIFTARIESSGFECVPVSVLERVNNFLNDVREELRHSMIKDSATIKNEGLAVSKHEEGTEEKIVASQDFQKKIIPHRDSEQAASSNGAVMGNNDISRLLFEMEEDDDTFNLAVESRKEAAETVRQSRQDLIVVASLVERIPNLAGLTRTCEIFRAGGLAVGDMGVVQDKQFRLISVTAEKWVPMVEVPAESVRAFLQRKRAEGYTVVGLEQTANSVALDEFVFPAKTVVVLGREKEGIPVDIIQEAVDVCVEIPQLGVVRSLNVHVSAAIAIWDYTRQQRSRS
uniref:tRNA (guanosine(18)-2'-O)-methyltransferase TARBP1 n=1 Tax=Aegilops tauschii subsp. strangulata TaxID=200361 RepID=A0A453JB67_AEGTS